MTPEIISDLIPLTVNEVMERHVKMDYVDAHCYNEELITSAMIEWGIIRLEEYKLQTHLTN